MEKLSERIKSDLEYLENTGMKSFPKGDIDIYIKEIEKLEIKIEYLKKQNNAFQDEYNKNGKTIKNIRKENETLKEKLNKYIQMACESRKSCNYECHNCEIDEDSEFLDKEES